MMAVVAGLLLAVAGEGPDFGHYSDWAAAALSGDIFQLRGNVLSPQGVPFSLAAAGPGLLFAIGKAVLVPLTLGSAAILTGWIATIVFWASAIIVMRRVGGDDDWLAWFGAGALFTGTHAGLYSHAYATEGFANALIAALWALALTRDRWRWIDSAMVGALAGLLLLVRAHVVLYAIPALWIAVFGGLTSRAVTSRLATSRFALGGGPEGLPLRTLLVRSIAVGIPLGVAVLQYAMVNRWMTGEPLHPPYVYGGNGFVSVDLRHPALVAVLTHPWHGLLSYHPLYGVAFVAVIVEAWRARQWRALWIVTAVAAVAHVWVQAGWYIWWLGGATFGLRGMAPAALPLVAGLIATIRRDADTRPRRASLWILLTVVSCAWSYPLLLQGNTQFYSWGPLLHSQRPAIVAGAVIVVLWIARHLTRRSITIADVEWEYRLAALAFAAATFAHLVRLLIVMPSPLTRLIKGAIGALVVAIGMVLGAARGAVVVRVPAFRAAVAVAALMVFSGQAIAFGRLAVRTERHIASGAPAPRPFEYVSASPVDELRVTYAEYRHVSGFDARKTAFRRFLAWQRVEASKMSARDRQIAEAVRTRIDGEPVFGDQLVEATTRDGVVQITARGMSDAQQSRARELALEVPGATAVIFHTD